MDLVTLGTLQYPVAALVNLGWPRRPDRRLASVIIRTDEALVRRNDGYARTANRR